jgi:hypothetical protein
VVPFVQFVQFSTTLIFSPPPQVIFSQTSELLERQSSMASSTEEVSGNMDVSTADSSRQHDTTDTEQRFGMYMREFDFLDCELESLEVSGVAFYTHFSFFELFCAIVSHCVTV